MKMSAPKETAVRTHGPDLIKAVRTRAGLSRADLAKRVGVTYGTVWIWENGQHSPSLETFLKVLEVTGYELLIRKKLEFY